jgi:hypothetical protein
MRLLSTTLLCALVVTQASAQTAVSKQLLELDHDERNAAFTLMLRDSRKCDQVVRTLFKGTVLGVDEREAICRDRRSYLFSILAEPDETVITFVSCRDLLTTSRKLLRRAGRKNRRPAAGLSESRAGTWGVAESGQLCLRCSLGLSL